MEGPAEGGRLERKTDSIAAEQQLRWAGLEAGMHALEVGCGTGAVTRVMARVAAPGTVVGVDQSVRRLTQAHALATSTGLSITLVGAEATCLPFKTHEFDYSWSRFLFEYLPHPDRALAELVRVTRRRGIVAVADLDGQMEQFYPLGNRLETTLQEGLRELRRTGFDPHIGRKLYHLFHRAGLEEVAVQVHPYQVYSGGVPEQEWPNWVSKVTTSAAVLVERTGDRGRWEEFRDEFLAHIRRPDVFYYCTLLVVRGRVPLSAPPEASGLEREPSGIEP